MIIISDTNSLYHNIKEKTIFYLNFLHKRAKNLKQCFHRFGQGEYYGVKGKGGQKNETQKKKTHMHSKAYRLHAHNAWAWNFYCQHNSVLSFDFSSGVGDYDFRRAVSFEALIMKG